jgi:hypothetical protein
MSNTLTPYWGTAPDWATSLAQDKDGQWHWYQSTPETTDDWWWCPNRYEPALLTGDGWKTTLRTRPEAGVAATKFVLTQADLKNLADYLKHSYELRTDHLYDDILHWLVESENV